MDLFATFPIFLTIVAETTKPNVNFSLDPAAIGSIITLVIMILGIYYTHRDKKQTYATYEKDLQSRLLADVEKLREYAEKYKMLRMEVLGSNSIDGDVLIAKVEREWDAMNIKDKK